MATDEMVTIDIHRFKETEAKEISDMIQHSIMEMNVGDYDMEVLMDQVKFYTPDRVKQLASMGHTYVATENKRVVACGSIVAPEDQPETAEIRSVFVMPEDTFRGIGRAIMTALETDEYYQNAKHIVVEASTSASDFCKKLGFNYVCGAPVFENRDHSRMEKFKD